MQLDDGLVDQTQLSFPPVIPLRKSLPQLQIRAFGMTPALHVTADVYLRDDSYWRLRSIYELALTSQTLATTGLALDVGAGYGCFTIPFALANRGWTVWAFEPDAEAFAALCQNIRAQGLTNVFAINAAVGPAVGPAIGTGSATGTEDWAKLAQALTTLAGAGPEDAAAMAGLRSVLQGQNFRQHVDMRGIVELGAPLSPEFDSVTYPTIPAEALLVLAPRFLKLTAPFAETAILSGLIDAELDHIVGESWTHLASHLIYGAARGLRQTWIPRAGDPMLRLRRTVSMNGNRPGLDVVVAMYNSANWIQECVDGILDGASKELRVLVVDDGSTDGSGDLVRSLYADRNQVVVLSKLNGGCASARNYGRLHSDASHIAFVDADDVCDPGLHSGLLELARHTGAEMVQAGFELLYSDLDGPRSEPSYEGQLPEITDAPRHSFGAQTCCMLPARLLMLGQPSIWRRVYRRDFLDNRKIWFPEHIRAFDDQIFQLLTLQQVIDVPMLDGVAYRYRQHPGQDIRQGDERSFYSLEMFRLMLKRGVSEGWTDFAPMLQSYVNTVNWCWSGLRADLRPAFEQGAAELWVYAQNTLDPAAFQDLPDNPFAPPDFAYYLRCLRAKLQPLDQSYGNIYLDSVNMHPALVKGRPA